MPDFKVDPNYMEVSERIAEFREHYPNGSLRPLNPERPWDIVTIGDRSFIWYAAAAYRSADDALPGVGVAWEPFPGTTPYTKNSELQNAETSAWGRAIIASLASSSKKVASANEVRNRQSEQSEQSPRRRPPPRPQPTLTPAPVATQRIADIRARLQGLDAERFEWTKQVAKEEGIPRFDSPHTKPEELDKLEGIIALAEIEQQGRPFDEEGQPEERF
jgi:hypothetical protein